MKKFLVRLALALFVALFGGTPYALAHVPLTPYDVHIYDLDLGEFVDELPRRETGYETVLLTAIFCEDPDMIMRLVKLYAGEGGFQAYIGELTRKVVRGDCKNTTLVRFRPTGFRASMSGLSFQGSDYIGPYAGGPDEIIIMRGYILSEQGDVGSVLYFAVPWRQASLR